MSPGGQFPLSLDTSESALLFCLMGDTHESIRIIGEMGNGIWDIWTRHLEAAQLLHFIGDEDECLRKIALAEADKDGAAWIAETWLELIGDLSRGGYWLEKAEAGNMNTYDCCLCAELRHKYFGDVARAERLARKAESVSKTWYDVESCAEIWRRLGNSAEADRCQLKARKLRK